MAELEEIGKRQEEILNSLIRDLDMDPDELKEQSKPAPRRQRRAANGSAKKGETDVAALAQRALSTDAKNVLMRASVDDDSINLPAGQLERPLYEEVNAALESLGGQWHRTRRTHVFKDLNGQDLSDAFYDMVEAGSWERAKDVGYYPTPDDLVDRMLKEADIQSHHRVLEPSAGQGAIVKKVAKIVASKNQICTFEILGSNQKVLHGMGFIVDGSDFLDFRAGPLFDRVVTNPPFNRGAAARHVWRAMELLKTGGRLVAIMPVSILQRQDQLHRAVRQQIVMHGTTHYLEDGTFRESGTDVRTVMIVWNKPPAWPVIALHWPSADPVVRPLPTAPEEPITVVGGDGAPSKAPRTFKRPVARRKLKRPRKINLGERRRATT